MYLRGWLVRIGDWPMRSGDVSVRARLRSINRGQVVDDRQTCGSTQPITFVSPASSEPWQATRNREEEEEGREEEKRI